MSPEEFDVLPFDPEGFSGIARLFPIPQLVMFPHVVQPLHVFEERYRELMEDALAGDSLIAIPILKPGWEAEYAGRPPLERWACLGKIVLHRQLDDGCYNLLLMGVSRIEILRELPPLRSFREAEVRVVSDVAPSLDDPTTIELREKLSGVIQHRGRQCETPDAVAQILENHCPLCQLTDLVAYALPLSLAVKQQLLAERCVLRRAEMLCEILARREEGGAENLAQPQGFPPRFSQN
jgi:Lon protease-like protein